MVFSHPPLGFNIIISLPSAIEWPPTVGYAQPPVGTPVVVKQPEGTNA